MCANDFRRRHRQDGGWRECGEEDKNIGGVFEMENSLLAEPGNSTRHLDLPAMDH